MTKRERLDWIVSECKEDIESLGIQIGRIGEVQINNRAKARYGRCSERTDTDGRYFVIQISDELLNDNVSNDAIKNTVAHELLHALADGSGMKHTGNWLKCAKELNQTYGYDIKRCTSRSEKGLAPRKRPLPNYIIRCMDCGCTYKYWRKTTTVKNILSGLYKKNYWCSRCKSYDLQVFSK